MSRKKRAVSEDTAHITRQEANITLRSNISLSHSENITPTKSVYLYCLKIYHNECLCLWIVLLLTKRVVQCIIMIYL